jgi:hypothetical protein
MMGMIRKKLHLAGDLVPHSLAAALAWADLDVVAFATLYVSAIGEEFHEAERSRGHEAAERAQDPADEGELLGGQLRSI